MLSSKAGISIEESNNMAEFERQVYLGLLVKDLKQKKQSYTIS